MANTFKVGDRVVGIMNHMDAVIKDKLGTVRTVEPTWIGVEFDEKVYYEDGDLCGHDLNHNAQTGYGYYVFPSEIAKVDEKELEHPDNTTNSTVSTIIAPPELNPIDRIRCAIISDTHPYAVLDSDGKLWFYAKRPETLSYFETAAVTPP